MEYLYQQMQHVQVSRLILTSELKCTIAQHETILVSVTHYTSLISERQASSGVWLKVVLVHKNAFAWHTNACAYASISIMS